MRTSYRLIAVAALLLTVSLALTGCIHLDRGIQLNGDGSGSYTLTIGLSDQLMSLGSDQITQQMNSYGDKVKQEGGSYRQYDDSGYTYWAYTRPFRSVAQLNQFLQETPAASSSSGSGGTGLGTTTTPTDSFQVTEDGGLFSNTFHVTGQMSMAATSSGVPNSGGDLPSLVKDMRETFAVTMPGSVTSHNGGTVNGNTVTYTVHYGESATIDVTGNGVNTAVVYPLAGGIAVLLLAALVAGYFIWQRRRTVSAAAAAAAAVAAPSTGADPNSTTLQ